MNFWRKLSDVNKYYLITFSSLGLMWAIFYLMNFEFMYIVFFIMSYVWHLALTVPGLKDRVLVSYHRLSFLSVIIRLNHYLQMFIKLKNIPYQTSIIRMLSPLIFTLVISVIVGQGSLLFTVLGSIFFEVIYIFVTKNTFNLLSGPSVQDTPPKIPNEEISPE